MKPWDCGRDLQQQLHTKLTVQNFMNHKYNRGGGQRSWLRYDSPSQDKPLHPSSRSSSSKFEVLLLLHFMLFYTYTKLLYISEGNNVFESANIFPTFPNSCIVLSLCGHIRDAVIHNKAKS